MSVDPISVTALVTGIKDVLEADPTLQDVWVQGEVSECFMAKSGHWYFTIKDEDASLPCVMWKGVASKQSALPELGGAFTFHGTVTVYRRNGKLQLQVDEVVPEGQGDLHVRFEALKQRLLEEGLFDRATPPPAFPRRIGIVTSPDAAALRDVCNVIGRRWPSAELLLAPTRVQGDTAPAEIVAAIQAIGRASVDVLILTRGGGSIEDLWAFNDEAVARALFACPHPTIAGVGHETDFTIVDFVADVRAPTPSAAAEVATPDGDELRQAVDDLAYRLSQRALGQLSQARVNADSLMHRMRQASPGREVARALGETIERRARLRRAMDGRTREARAATTAFERRLESLNPAAILARGYAHVTRGQDGRTVRSTADVGPGVGLRVQVADGRFDAVVAGQASLFDGLEDGGPSESSAD
jgi:exodeoxyribonuclease VII large subunit